MTQPQGDAWAARLTQIWVPESFFFLVNVIGIKNSAEFGDGMPLIVTIGDTWASIHKDYTLCREATCLGCEAGQCFSLTSKSHKTRGWEQQEQAFATQWMPFFRCDCWLSGAVIEATAHEKAEWIRTLPQRRLKHGTFIFERAN